MFLSDNLNEKKVQIVFLFINFILMSFKGIGTFQPGDNEGIFRVLFHFVFQMAQLLVFSFQISFAAHLALKLNLLSLECFFFQSRLKSFWDIFVIILEGPILG